MFFVFYFQCVEVAFIVVLLVLLYWKKMERVVIYLLITSLLGKLLKCSKKLTLFLFSTKLLVFRAGNHKMLIRIANSEDPDQTASSEIYHAHKC